MKIADGLELMVSISKEKKRLEGLAEKDSWSYRSTDPNAKWEPNFDIEENHKRVKELDKKLRKLKRAISVTNNTIDIANIDEKEFVDWM